MSKRSSSQSPVSRVKRVAKETGQQLAHLAEVGREQLNEGLDRSKELFSDGRDAVSSRISRLTS